jgi:type I restriction enzyme S subunit
LTATRLKYLCYDTGQYGYNWPASEYVTADAGLRLLRTTDLKPEGLLPASEGVFVPRPVPAEFLLKQHDLLLTRAGSVGRCYLVPEEASGLTFAGFLVRFRPRPATDARFLAYSLQSTPVQEAVQAEAISSTIQNFNAER